MRCISEEDEDEDSAQWNLRKCAASALDRLSNRFQGAILEWVLPQLDRQLGDATNWMVRESGILSLGAVADGCYDHLESHLPRLLPYLVQLLADPKPLIRTIACWTVSRFVKWVVAQPVCLLFLFFS
jgi:hypothetical protein